MLSLVMVAGILLIGLPVWGEGVPCKTETVQKYVSSNIYEPEYWSGTLFDIWSAGRNVRVEATFWLSLTEERTVVMGHLYVRLAKTGAPWYTGDGTQDFEIYRLSDEQKKEGYTIDSIPGPTRSVQRFESKDTQCCGWHVVKTTDGGPVWGWFLWTLVKKFHLTAFVQPQFTPLKIVLAKVVGFCEVSPPLATFPACKWTEVFSEEEGSRTCDPGFAARGIECVGAYCDGMALYCCPFVAEADSRKNSGASAPLTRMVNGSRVDWWISEEGPNNYFEAPGQILTGLKCRNSYSDDLQGIFWSSSKLSTPDCDPWTDYVSEEDRGQALCAPGKFIVGVRCRGGYCDDISVRCCKAVLASDSRSHSHSP